jgi:hypothetical protein
LLNIGHIIFAANSRVVHDVTTVNRNIILTKTSVGNDIQTQNGFITLLQGSVVEGDIEFESQNDSSG